MSSFIGNQPATSFETVRKQVSTSNSGTTITLDYPVTNVADIRLTINAVVQSYDNYSVSGSTLTVGGTLNNDRVEILFVGRTFGTIAPELTANSVSNSAITNDAVTVDKLNLISTGSVPSLEAKGTSGVTEGYIQLNCAENSHGIKLKSPPHSAGASYTLTFPNNDGDANQFLQTNGSGVLTFADAGGSNTPHWEVGLNSDQGIPNSTMTKLQFSVDRKNASGSPDYWDNSNYRTQNLTAGDYFAYLNLTFEGNAGSSTAYILIKRYNSSNVEQQSSGKALDQWTKQGQYHGSIFSVASGDYIAYELWQNSGGTVTQLYEAGDGSLCFGGGFKIT